jgi:hypothetical protein
MSAMAPIAPPRAHHHLRLARNVEEDEGAAGKHAEQREAHCHGEIHALSLRSERLGTKVPGPGSG